MRALLVATLALAAAPAAAAAAPFGELPFRPQRGAAVCLAPAGAPGEVVRWVSSGVEVLSATPAGLVPQATVALGPVWSCPVAATDASGAGVIAAAGSRAVRIAVRDPGGSWGAALAIPAKLAGEVAVATSARGDAIVAWAEYEPSSAVAHVLVARRSAGGAFGTPQRFAQPVRLQHLQAAVTADGSALLVAATSQALQLASAPPGEPFGVPRTLVRRGDGYGDGVKLAVLPDGRGLLAADVGDGVALFDREPSGTLTQRPTLAFGGAAFDLALAPDGSAVIASESGGYVNAILREGLGPFGAPAHLEVRPRPSEFGGTLGVIGGVIAEDGVPLERSTPLRVALGADHRALLTWAVGGRGLRTATLTPAGFSDLAPLASPIRDALGASPLILADGTRTVAWTDGNDVLEGPPFDARLHFAVEGAASTADLPAPGLKVGAPADRSLRPVDTLVLPVRCAAACDLHASIAGQEDLSVSQPRAGTVRLRVKPGSGPVAPKRGALKVVLRWSAPGSSIAKTRRLSVRLRRLPAPPFPRILDARATRGPGGVVDVRWRADVPARDMRFVVYGTRTRRLAGLRAENIGFADGAGRRTFHVRLRDAKRVRYIHLVAGQKVGGRTRKVLISVRSRA